MDKNIWLEKQWEWFKSFFSEPPDKNGYLKGSHKIFLSYWIIIAFCTAWFRKVLNIPSTDPIPDVPENWALLIFGILGLGVVLRFLEYRENKRERIEENKNAE